MIDKSCRYASAYPQVVKKIQDGELHCSWITNVAATEGAKQDRLGMFEWVFNLKSQSDMTDSETFPRIRYGRAYWGDMACFDAAIEMTSMKASTFDFDSWLLRLCLLQGKSSTYRRVHHQLH